VLHARTRLCLRRNLQLKAAGAQLSKPQSISL
jgi:hypothetical protein